MIVCDAAAHGIAQADRENLNVEGAFRLNLFQAYASLGTAITAGIIPTTASR